MREYSRQGNEFELVPMVTESFVSKREIRGDNFDLIETTLLSVQNTKIVLTNGDIC